MGNYTILSLDKKEAKKARQLAEQEQAKAMEDMDLDPVVLSGPSTKPAKRKHDEDHVDEKADEVDPSKVDDDERRKKVAKITPSDEATIEAKKTPQG